MNTGDVLLLTGDAKSSRYLATAQKFLYRGARSSHVMLSLGDGAFIHSTPQGGVDFAFYPAMKPQLTEGWTVIRRNDLTEADAEELMKSAIFHVDQSYNYKFFLEGTASSFCSELVAKVYARAGLMDSTAPKPQKITPAYFDKLADEAKTWTNVTNLYEIGFANIEANSHMYWIAHRTLQGAVRKRQMMLHHTDKLLDMMKTASTSGVLSDELYQQTLKMEAEFRAKKNISFWNERDYSEQSPVAEEDSSEVTKRNNAPPPEPGGGGST